MLDWVQDHLTEVGLDIFESTDVFPGGRWDLNDGISQTRWVDLEASEVEVFICDEHGVKDFGINRVIIDVDNVHLLSDTLEGSFLAER